MSFFQSKSTLMLGIALLLTGLGLIFGPAFAPVIGQTPATASPGTALASNVTSTRGYTDRLIATSQDKVKSNPKDAKALSGLGLAYLQKARETNDPTFYVQAEGALKKALEITPDYYDALSGMGSLELSRHNFKQAEDWGIKAQKSVPNKAYAYGVVGDARIELGNYDEAIASFQQMVDLRPDLGSYSRVSYARELYGDTAGAIEAMQQAIEAGSPAAENTAWCRVQLGNLYFNSNKLVEAENAYNGALAMYPDYLHAIAGLAQVRWAQGKTDEAVKLYKQAVAVVPLPQYLTALGDLYLKAGNTAAAKEQYDLVGYIFKVFETNGVDVGVEKAAFLSEYDTNVPEAVKLIEEASGRRQDIHTQDTLAWTLFKAGRYEEALAAEQKAMRLGTQSSIFYYHLGMIQSKLGDSKNAATSLKKALDINPNFSILHASEAANMLAKLNK